MASSKRLIFKPKASYDNPQHKPTFNVTRPVMLPTRYIFSRQRQGSMDITCQLHLRFKF
jgi:hypothetical protein